MKKQVIFLLALVSLIVFACQKELSFEGSNTPAEGSLQSDITGDCLPKSVNGTYTAGVALVPATNTITVQVNVTKTGTYTIGTDTVNGYYFRGTGTFTTLGANTITLRGNGTPFANGTNNFVVSFDGTVCDIQVQVISAGVGTLAGAPNACAPITVNGGYSPGVALTSGNNAVVQVNVTTAGALSITTDTIAGIWFTYTGNLPLGNNQNITLQAQGAIPAGTTTGNKTFTVKLGTSRCTFVVNVAGPGAGTLGGAGGTCTPATVNGAYAQGVLLAATNTVDVQVNVTTAGAFNITTNTVAGFSFSFSGVLASGTQTVTLIGAGTPTASGSQVFTVNLNTTPASSCTFTVTVAGPAVFTIDCPNVVVNGTYQVGINLTAANTITIPITVTTAGPYNISASINGMTFSASGTLTLSSTSITLIGNTATSPAGPANTYNLSVGSPACLIPITVAAAPTIDWKFNIGATLYQGSSDLPNIVFDNTSLPPFTILDYYGINAANDDFNLTLIDLNGGILANENYNTTSVGLTNGGTFYFSDLAGTIDLVAEPGAPPIGNIAIKVTSHNTATKTIIGTFSGTAFDNISSTTKTITNGSFTAVYQ